MIKGKKKRVRSPRCSSTEYKSWLKMKERCLNKNHDAYKWYGGDGVIICDRWLNSFDNFLLDMGRKPSPKHSIDRVNGAKIYSKDTCRWSDAITQCNNRRSNRLLTYNGETKTLSMWARQSNLGYRTIQKRLDDGWTIEQTLETQKRTWPGPINVRSL